MSSNENPNPDPTPEPDPVDQTDDVAALRHEAASRRRALRAVEAERDALRAQRDERDRQDVERMVADHLADPSDFWHSTSLDDLRSEDGIDKDRARGELQKLLAAKPHYAKPPPPPPMPDVHHGPRGTVDKPKPPSFGETLKRGLTG